MQTSLRRLHYFREVADTLNFRRAASALNITQPALSRAIAQLEQDLEVQLFERSKAQVKLTQAGRTFVIECDRVLATLDSAMEETRRVARGEIGSLAIGYTDTAMADVLPDIIETFREVSPGVSIRLHQVPTNAQVLMLRNGQLDVGFLTGPVDQARFSAVPVQQDHLVVLTSKENPLARRRSLSLWDLANEPFVLGDPVDWHVYNDKLLRLCEQAGFAPRIVQTAPESQAIIGLVSCGLGLTIIPESHAKTRDARTVAIPIKGGIAPMLTEAVWISGRDHPALTRFINHIARYDLHKVDP